MSHMKKDKFRLFEIVMHAKRTNLDHLKLSCMLKGKIYRIWICLFEGDTNLDHINLSGMQKGQIQGILICPTWKKGQILNSKFVRALKGQI